ncbi:High mobility group protein 20A [Armadillidium nasatum]|uniref:High mobility group protein 20A n=1 Tax=Armadillidium nasatum TaxID=96803 RepID=A0A5N5TES0_9CRUS|nr:High mobility group protein 20A [Armadillidium nasatum]
MVTNIFRVIVINQHLFHILKAESFQYSGQKQVPPKRYGISVEALNILIVKVLLGIHIKGKRIKAYILPNWLNQCVQCYLVMTTGAASSSNSDTSPNKKKGWPRGRKRRLMPKDNNAPKGPLSGYMLFMNEQREILKQSEKKLGFQETNKIVAQKWSQLEGSEKQKYLEAAEADKGRYQQEVEEYKKTDTYKKFVENQKEKNNAKRAKKESSSNSNKCQRIIVYWKYQYSLRKFLNHNKIREAELRQLRKSNTEYEEQNTILQKHVESMRNE